MQTEQGQFSSGVQGYVQCHLTRKVSAVSKLGNKVKAKAEKGQRERERLKSIDEYVQEDCLMFMLLPTTGTFVDTSQYINTAPHDKRLTLNSVLMVVFSLAVKLFPSQNCWNHIYIFSFNRLKNVLVWKQLVAVGRCPWTWRAENWKCYSWDPYQSTDESVPIFRGSPLPNHASTSQVWLQNKPVLLKTVYDFKKGGCYVIFQIIILYFYVVY